MNTRIFTLYMTGTLLLATGSTTLHADDFIDLRKITPVQGDIATGETKATVCIACHGPSGNSIVPTFPRLAGQRVDYMYWRLVDYKRGARPDSPMTPIVESLSNTDLRDLAAYFAAQIPASDTTTPAISSTTLGETLFRTGDPARGIPPCQGCHGADAQGTTDARFLTWPVLRGQYADYVVTRLTEFREGKYTTTSDSLIMQSVVQGLDDDDMRAIGTWLESLPLTN